MGLLEELESLDLADDVKDRLRREHQTEIQSGQEELAQLRAKDRREETEREIEGLKKLGFSEAPGLLKFVRRILLSDDKEPGLVLLSDNEMQLAGDDATGASNREEITVAGAVRKFIELLPRTDEGKVQLSEQILATDDDVKPKDDDEPDPVEKSREASERLGNITGQKVKRTRNRYRGGMIAAGGDS